MNECKTTCTLGVENNLNSKDIKEAYELVDKYGSIIPKGLEVNPVFFKALSKKTKIKEVTKFGYEFGMPVFIIPDLKEPYRFIYE